MARPLRTQFPGAAYHVTARGVRRQAIFRDDDDRSCFLSLLEKVMRRHDWSCLAFCLMTTHYHLVIRTPDTNLAIGMQRLNGHFAQGLNRKYGEKGHLFESRYHSVLIERNAHLIELYRYLALNPVRAGLCSRPESWPWSSYAVALGTGTSSVVLAAEWALTYFGSDPDRARDRLRAFVEDGSS
jgi:putative transposase